MITREQYSTSHPRCDVLLVAATLIEMRAVLDAFYRVTNHEATIYIRHGKTYYDLHEIACARVSLVQSGMSSRGPDGSTLTSMESILTLKPQKIIMVGIAYGLKPQTQQIGEILVSSHIRDYERQRIGLGPNNEMQSVQRGDRPQASTQLLDRCRSAQIDWKGPKVHVGLLLSGDKLVDHAEFLTQLRAVEPEAIGGEMEAAGLYAAAHREKVDWIVIKAISDWADGNKKDQEEEKRQQLAASNAAAFVISVLQQGEIVIRRSAIQNGFRSWHIPNTLWKQKQVWRPAFAGIFILTTILLLSAVFTQIFSLIAPIKASTTLAGQPTIDGIPCIGFNSYFHHFHLHLSVHIDELHRKPLVIIPGDVGVQNGCFYLLRTYNTTGEINVAQDQREYTLGNFLGIWAKTEPASYPSELTGDDAWSACVNGDLVPYDFHEIRLESHQLITLIYKSPLAKCDKIYNWVPGDTP